MKKIHSVMEISDVRGKHVLVRVPFDVPMIDGVIQSDFRIVRALPTITHLMLGGAKVVLLTHLGRNPKTTLEVLAQALQEYVPITYVPALLGSVVTDALAKMEEGEVVLLENLRSHEGEEKNDAAFGAMLASYGEYYVNDAFAVSHRPHASIVGIPKYIPSFAGVSFLDEYTELSKVLKPHSPSLFILGGAKFETKEPLVEEYSRDYTHTFIGGALANDFLKGKGFPVGESLLSSVDMKGNLLLERESIILPVDVVVGGEHGKREVLVEHVQSDEKILDVGPRSVDALAPFIREAETIVWNGPLGNYEGGFDDATKRCAEMIATSDAYSVVGGGDTVTAIESLGITESFGFVSTAGGAMLDFLEHKTLPGIEALKQ
ncbi:phosphoglycerate kinase [Candidatus Kaiserbacteria bacterium]|nr:MAG: phosphoglycerate kinase [Candidatus Kaiserbacteria bacterium]